MVILIVLCFCLCYCLVAVIHLHLAVKARGTESGVHLWGGFAPTRIQVSYFFLQSYYEMIKGIQHVHVL